jgi:hypothetical protein
MDLVGFSGIAKRAQGKNRFNVEEILKLIILLRVIFYTLNQSDPFIA